ncbi:MAG: hypothetical protein ACTS4X_00850 [Candidatus Hodgkinia cicadicola]
MRDRRVNSLYSKKPNTNHRGIAKRSFRHKRKSLVKVINLRNSNVRRKPNEHYSVKTLRSMLRI